MRTLTPDLTSIDHRWLPRVTVVALALLIAFSAPISGAAQTLQSTDFVTESGDHSLVWNENWTASLLSEDDFSTMVMLEGQIMIYAVMFIHDEDLNLSMSAVYHSLSGVLVNQFDAAPTQSIEWDEGDGSFRGAHVLQLSGIDFVLFLRVDPPGERGGPTMQFAAAPLRAFPVSLEAMQEELTVDGVPVFEGDDGEDVMSRLDNGAASTTDATDTSDEATPAAEQVDRPLSDRSRLNRDAQLTSGQDTQPDGGTYVSEANGFTVDYPESWSDMAATDSTIGEFSLTAESGRSVVSFSGRSTTETNREAFFQDIVARESRYPGFVGNVITKDRLLLATWTADNELAVLEYVFIDDSTVVTIMATITSGNPANYIEDVQDIELDGEPILRDWEELWPDD